jgi:hypothetical protein
MPTALQDIVLPAMELAIWENVIFILCRQKKTAFLIVSQQKDSQQLEKIAMKHKKCTHMACDNEQVFDDTYHLCSAHWLKAFDERHPRKKKEVGRNPRTIEPKFPVGTKCANEGCENVLRPLAIVDTCEPCRQAVQNREWIKKKKRRRNAAKKAARIMKKMRNAREI